ncbi:T9SS type A sorting domain-containing protein [Taibaiella soli]|uniref:Secretion system C-terminal sorting domain-containing protein n=1 Tax=Taibaiella soli TaxID=1649169 RepID=A0A2W2A7F0_9BACT|nr:T9SS type A sorting domain-containing protein [Taibaiella soli]PZF71255.1 hypothetical protein DN068_18325 [Taibaiella soli]
MKRLLLILLAGSFFFSVKAQMQSSSINFDNYTSATDNDFVNNFTLTRAGLVQIPGTGITGGGVQLSSRGGEAVFNQLGNLSRLPTTMSVCFKFDKYSFQNKGNGPSVELKIMQCNHTGYISISAERELITIASPSGSCSYTFVNGGTLVDGNWYKLEGNVSINGNVCSISLFDLGSDGLAAPIFVRNGTFYTGSNDFYTYSNEPVKLILSGNGGASYLDSFYVSWWASSLGVDNLSSIPGLNVASVVSNELSLSIQSDQQCTYEIWTLNGSRIERGIFNRNVNINTSDLSPATYIIVVGSGGSMVSKRFVKL